MEGMKSAIVVTTDRDVEYDSNSESRVDSMVGDEECWAEPSSRLFAARMLMTRMTSARIYCTHKKWGSPKAYRARQPANVEIAATVRLTVQ